VRFAALRRVLGILVSGQPLNCSTSRRTGGETSRSGPRSSTECRSGIMPNASALESLAGGGEGISSHVYCKFNAEADRDCGNSRGSAHEVASVETVYLTNVRPWLESGTPLPKGRVLLNR
jgi:hypothetical protein